MEPSWAEYATCRGAASQRDRRCLSGLRRGIAAGRLEGSLAQKTTVRLSFRLSLHPLPRQQISPTYKVRASSFIVLVVLVYTCHHLSASSTCNSSLYFRRSDTLWQYRRQLHLPLVFLHRGRTLTILQLLQAQVEPLAHTCNFLSQIRHRIHLIHSFVHHSNSRIHPACRAISCVLSLSRVRAT